MKDLTGHYEKLVAIGWEPADAKAWATRKAERLPAMDPTSAPLLARLLRFELRDSSFREAS